MPLSTNGATAKRKHGCLKPCFKAGKGIRTLDIQLGKYRNCGLFQVFQAFFTNQQQ
jgi:hypothetical protein